MMTSDIIFTYKLPPTGLVSRTWVGLKLKIYSVENSKQIFFPLTLHLHRESVACGGWDPVAGKKEFTKQLEIIVFSNVSSSPCDAEIIAHVEPRDLLHLQLRSLNNVHLRTNNNSLLIFKHFFTFLPPITISSPSSLLQTIWGFG